MKIKSILVLAGLLALAVPAAAGAHVTLQPSTVAAGDETVLNVRVPNEEDSAATTKVQLQLPSGFTSALNQPVPGWSVKVKTQKLAKPVQTDDGPISEEVRQITWTADGAQSGIGPGQFQDFPLAVQIPDKAGVTLTFKALQSYSDGSVVRWIGAPDSEEPAPQVTVTEAATDGGNSHPMDSGPESADSGSHGSGDNSDSASKGLGIAALVLGALGLLAGGTALVRSRRTS